MYICATYLFLDIYKVYPILRNRKVIYKADATVEHEEQIKKLRHEQAALQKKVATLKQTHGKTWVDLKSSVEKAALELKASLDKALLRYM